MHLRQARVISAFVVVIRLTKVLFIGSCSKKQITALTSNLKICIKQAEFRSQFKGQIVYRPALVALHESVSQEWNWKKFLNMISWHQKMLMDHTKHTEKSV